MKRIIKNKLSFDFAYLITTCEEMITDIGFVCDIPEDIEPYQSLTCSIMEQLPFEISETNMILSLMNKSLFECKDGAFLFNQYVCDGHVDCKMDGRDEINCTSVCKIVPERIVASPEYCYRNCHAANCSCMPLYYQCHCGGCVPAGTVCDSYNDCADASDEMKDLCSV